MNFKSLLIISCNREMRGAIAEGLLQRLMIICRRKVYGGGQLSLECTECRESNHMWQALIRGESQGLVMKGVEVRPGHVKEEIKVYGPYHLVSCLSVQIQRLFRCVGGDSA